MKKFYKKIMLCFCIVSLFCLTGCAKVTYSLIRNDDYTIIQQINVELDIEDIERHNADVQEMKQTIEEFITSYVSNLQTNFSLNITSLAMSHDPYYSALAPYLKDSVTTYSIWNGNTYYFSIKFSAVKDDVNLYIPVEKVYYYYYTGEFEYNDEDDDDTKSILTEDLFVKTYSETSTTTFNSEMCGLVEEVFLAKYGSYGFTLDDVSYIYNYGQQYSRLHSDADFISYKNGVYIHTWNLSDKSQEITLYRNYAKPIAWYVVSIIVGFVVSVIFILISFIIKRKSNKIDV